MDFCGFKFNGHHSSEMGFIRVSDGSRYTEELGPAFQDRTIPIPGGDGAYFFESNYTQKPFPINIAFDSMTEEQMRLMRQVFNGKDVGPLIFDESPYKTYTVKLQSPPQLKYICFDDENGQRVYKGEGTISFISYSSYAVNTDGKKYLNQFGGRDYPNKFEWQSASHMLADSIGVGTSGTSLSIYNAGDVETDLKIYFQVSDSPINITVALNNARLNLANVVAQSTTDSFICINTKTNLIEGYTSNTNFSYPGVRSSYLYNKFITAGEFFKAPVDWSTLSCSPGCYAIEYNYLYY